MRSYWVKSVKNTRIIRRGKLLSYIGIYIGKFHFQDRDYIHGGIISINACITMSETLGYGCQLCTCLRQWPWPIPIKSCVSSCHSLVIQKQPIKLHICNKEHNKSLLCIIMALTCSQKTFSYHICACIIQWPNYM